MIAEEDMDRLVSIDELIHSAPSKPSGTDMVRYSRSPYAFCPTLKSLFIDQLAAFVASNVIKFSKNTPLPIFTDEDTELELLDATELELELEEPKLELEPEPELELEPEPELELELEPEPELGDTTATLRTGGGKKSMSLAM